MGLETFTYINSLVITNPDGNVDFKSAGDDHIRGVKTTLKNSFPNVNGAVNPTPTEFNRLVGILSDIVELSGTQTLTGNKTFNGVTVLGGATTLNGALSGASVDTDIALAANSDTKVPSQKAVKTHIANATKPTILATPYNMSSVLSSSQIAILNAYATFDVSAAGGDAAAAAAAGATALLIRFRWSHNINGASRSFHRAYAVPGGTGGTPSPGSIEKHYHQVMRDVYDFSVDPEVTTAGIWVSVDANSDFDYSLQSYFPDTSISSTIGVYVDLLGYIA